MKDNRKPTDNCPDCCTRDELNRVKAEKFKLLNHIKDADGQLETFADEVESLKADCKLMANALLEAHVKTWIRAEAVNVAGKYQGAP